MGIRLLATRSSMRRLVGGGGVDLYPKTKSCGVAATSNTWRLQQLGYYSSRLPSFAIGCHHNIHTIAIPSSLHISSSLYYNNQNLHNTIQKYHQSSSIPQTQQTQQQQCRHLSSSGKRKKKGVDTNEPLINEHLIAELFNISKDRKNNDNSITADSYEVRLIVDMGHDKKKKKIKKEKDDDNDASSLEEEEEEDSSTSTTTTNQLTTLNEAIAIAHKHSLDLMAVNITNVTPPVIKAVNYDKWLYEQKKNAITKSKKKKKMNNNSIGGGGGGAISDKSLKEYKFRAGIDQHDLERKANNMIKYLRKGHAIRVTLTARYKSLNQDADAISTTLERVKELVGDLAIEARGMKANDRKSYGSFIVPSQPEEEVI